MNEKYSKIIINTNLNNTIVEHLKNIEKYKINTKEFTELYSEEGIFHIINNNVKQVIFKTSNFNKKFYAYDCINKKISKNINIIIDNNYIDYSQITQIPYNHISIKKIRDIYKFQINSNLEFIIEYILDNNNTINICDYYFLINDKTINDNSGTDKTINDNSGTDLLINYKKDIISFLSLII
jgi:hypothetical protein